MTGCTYGKGNLIHLDYGKNAFTFFRRSDGRGLRLVTRPDAFGPRSPERAALAEHVRAGRGSEEDRQAFQELQSQRSEAILAAAPETLFARQAVDEPPPRKARIHTSLVCADCDEQVMETRVRQFGGLTLCPPCFERKDSRL